MKKPYFLLFCLIAFISLVACNDQKDNNEVDEENEVEAPINEEPVEEETEEESLDATETDDESPDAEESEEESTDAEENDGDKPIVYENEVFKDVVVSELGDLIIVKGKAQVFEGVFQYRLLDNDKVLLEDNYQTEGAPAWGDFEISIEKSIVNANNVVLELFVYSAKDGEKINVLEVPITP